MNKWYLRLPVAGKAILLVLALHMTTLVVLAQSQLQWAPQERIPGYDPKTWTPYLVADKNRTVHVFASSLLGDDSSVDKNSIRAIFYRQWTLDGGWTEPNDILLPPIKSEARIQGALLDESGMMHIIFYAGDEQGANIYYSRAPAFLAGRASAWSTPKIIGPTANINDNAVLVDDRQGNLYMIYSGELRGKGLYVTNSNDEGSTWSEPVSMFLAYDEDLTPYDLKTHVDAQNNIHLVWTIRNKTGNTKTIYYGRLEAGQRSWSTPTEVDQVGDLPAGEPSIIEYDQELFLIHHAASPQGVTRYMRRSDDGGNTWSDKVRLFPHVGSGGAASLVIDSNDVLHMFFGNRITIDGVINQGMWHSVWRDGQWTAPQAIVVGPGRPDFDPSRANAIVSQGNVILTTWMTDPGLTDRGTFYSYVVLDAPELPVTPLAMPAATPAPMAASNLAPTPAPVNEVTKDPSAPAVFFVNI